MRKILLVIDEYTELVELENLLRRLGFDVLSVGKDILVGDALLRFQPELVITSFKGRAVDGAKVISRVSKLSNPVKLVFLLNADNAASIKTEAREQVDGVLVSPLKPHNAIRLIAQVGNLDPGPLIEKFERMRANRAVDGASSKNLEPQKYDPFKTAGQASTLRTERSDRYDVFLRANSEPVTGVLAREKMTAASKQLKAVSEGESQAQPQGAPAGPDLEAEKREFVRAIFEPGDSGASGNAGEIDPSSDRKK